MGFCLDRLLQKSIVVSFYQICQTRSICYFPDSSLDEIRKQMVNFRVLLGRDNPVKAFPVHNGVLEIVEESSGGGKRLSFGRVKPSVNDQTDNVWVFVYLLAFDVFRATNEFCSLE